MTQYSAQDLLKLVDAGDEAKRIMSEINDTLERLGNTNPDESPMAFEEVLDSLFTKPRIDALALVAVLSLLTYKDECWSKFMTALQAHARNYTN